MMATIRVLVLNPDGGLCLYFSYKRTYLRWPTKVIIKRLDFQTYFTRRLVNKKYVAYRLAV